MFVIFVCLDLNGVGDWSFEILVVEIILICMRIGGEVVVNIKN